MSDKAADVSTHSQARHTLLEKELRRFLPLLQQHYRPHKIILFGSLAEDQVGEWSDLDLVIVAETDKRFLDRVKEAILLLKHVDFLLCDPHTMKPIIAFELDDSSHGRADRISPRRNGAKGAKRSKGTRCFS